MTRMEGKIGPAAHQHAKGAQLVYPNKLRQPLLFFRRVAELDG